MNNDFINKFSLEYYSDIIKKRTSVPGIIEAYKNLKIIDNIYKSKS